MRLRLAGLAMVLSLGPGPLQAQDRMKVVTTFTVIADMARNGAGDAADAVSITKPGAEIHGYEPTPGDIIGAGGADVILWNGLGLERWSVPFPDDPGDVPGVVVSDGTDPWASPRASTRASRTPTPG